MRQVEPTDCLLLHLSCADVDRDPVFGVKLRGRLTTKTNVISNRLATFNLPSSEVITSNYGSSVH